MYNRSCHCYIKEIVFCWLTMIILIKKYNEPITVTVAVYPFVDIFNKIKISSLTRKKENN